MGYSDFEEQEPDFSQALAIRSKLNPIHKISYRYYYYDVKTFVTKARRGFAAYCVTLSEQFRRFEPLLSAFAIFAILLHLTFLHAHFIWPVKIPNYTKTDPFALQAFGDTFDSLTSLANVTSTLHELQTTITQPLLDVIDNQGHPSSNTLWHQVHTLNKRFGEEKVAAQELVSHITRAVYTTDKRATGIIAWSNLQTHTFQSWFQNSNSMNSHKILDTKPRNMVYNLVVQTSHLGSWLSSNQLSTSNQKILDEYLGAMVLDLAVHASSIHDRIEKLGLWDLRNDISMLMTTEEKILRSKKSQCTNAVRKVYLRYLWPTNKAASCDTPDTGILEHLKKLDTEIVHLQQIVKEAAYTLRKAEMVAKVKAYGGVSRVGEKVRTRGQLLGLVRHLDAYVLRTGKITGLIDVRVDEETGRFIGFQFV